MTGERLSTGLLERIELAGRRGEALVSPVSAWEIGLLARRHGGEIFSPDPKVWFSRLLAHPVVTLTPLTPARAIDASHLPGDLHRDPADRLLAATARDLGAALVTGDRPLLAYAAQGHMQAIPC